MRLSTDVATGVADIVLGLVAVIWIAVLAARQRWRRLPAEMTENGTQRFVRVGGVAAGRTRVP
jgi:hypothetical protein